jgi:AcrR family transcriptional regulator
MAIPPASRAISEVDAAATDVWDDLDADAKRARLLDASREVFARDGIDAPMPAVAAAAGIGVGSIYRQFPSKLDLLAALVIEHMDEVTTVAAGRPGPDGAWAALVELIWHFAARQAGDDVVAEALSCVMVEPSVAAARARTNDALARLMDAARAEGRLRDDATVVDLRIIFAGARAAEKVEPGGWHRLIELGVDSLAV